MSNASLTVPLTNGTKDNGVVVGDTRNEPNSSAQSPQISKASNNSFRTQELLSLSKLTLGLDEPVELQIETMSPAAGRFMFYFWYLLLILAIVVQSIITLQWQSSNMCNGNAVSLTDIGSWASPCATQFNYSVTTNSATNATEHLSDVVWAGYINTDPLARFLHLVFSMRNPNITTSTTYRIAFGYTITNTTTLTTNVTMPNSTSIFSVECREGAWRCSTVVMPTQSTGRPNATHVTLIAVGMDAEIGALILSDSAVGTVNQKASYTITSIVVRYTLMFFSLLHLARFLYHKKFTSTLYEQTWISILHGGLFLYLDPLFAAGVYIVPEPNVLSFLEFRVPTYFMTLMVAFMFSLITSSMSWTSATSLYHPPWWTKIASLVFLLAIFTLDIVDASLDEWNWNLEHCPNFSCNTLGYILYGLLIFGVLLCTLWLFWLRNNLGQKPYLDSRPQQLAVRVFIFMFTTTVLYFVVLMLTIFFAFRDISGIVTYQALIQIPAILVSTFFVNIMTLVYTTTVRSQRVPIRPSDERWKKAVWPESWYQWLSRHGGSMYIFNNEEEESLFYQIQAKFAVRRARALVGDHPAMGTQAALASDDILIASETDCDTDGTTELPPPPRVRFDDATDEDDYSSEEEEEEEDEDDHSTPPRSPRRSPLRGGGTSPPQSPTTGRRSSVAANAPYGLSASASQPLFRESMAKDTKKKKKKKKKAGRHRIASKIPGGARIMDAVSSVTRSVSRLVVRAENELIDRTATFLDAMENRFIDIFNSKLRHKPFFNLETAIDCLNLSWEAYGVVVSQGDGLISTGVNVRLPDVETAAQRALKTMTSLFPCCLRKKKAGDEEEGPRIEKEAGSSAREASLPTTSPRSQERGDEGDPLTDKESDPSATPTNRTPYGTANTLPSTPPVAVPINTEQYGYARIAVAEEAAVQVVISRMLPDLKCHQGKSPRIVIAFRGTDSVANAKQDLDIRRVIWEEVDHTLWQQASVSRPSVHVGFLGIWNALRDFVTSTVMGELDKLSSASYDEQQEPHRVYVTGHSMGGAVATLCAFAMRKRLMEAGYQFPDPVVYTYGQPRIGNKTFQKAYNKAIPNTFRVVNESDAISFVTMFGGCHVGMEVDVDRNGNYLCEPMFMERTLRPIKGKGSAFANHLLSAYAESLNAIAGKCGQCVSRCLEPYVPLPLPSHQQIETPRGSKASHNNSREDSPEKNVH